MISATPRPLLVGALAALAIGGYRLTFGAQSQAFGPFPYRGGIDANVVALTFDDGPNEPYTSTLLDVLADRGVLATFFQVGRCAERFPGTTRRVVEDGHVLGNHSQNHALRSYLTEPDQHNEISQAQKVLFDIAGVRPALYRPPWLCHPPWVLASIRSCGLQVVSGTFGHPLEILQPSGSVLAAGAARRGTPGSILIFHDGREARGGRRAQTVAAVGPLIDRLRDQGYGFTTVDRLLGVNPYLGAADARPVEAGR